MRPAQAYGGGWSGAARERGARVRPVEQLEAAKAREGELKLTVRQAMRVMHESGGDVRIPAEAYDSDGELDEEHIICSKCGSGELCAVTLSCGGSICVARVLRVPPRAAHVFV